jgi:hypothetical protein
MTMRVTYAVNGEANDYETHEEEDLRDLVTEIEQYVREQHAELKDEARLPMVIADGVLNSLCDDADEITLGELHQAT